MSVRRASSAFAPTTRRDSPTPARKIVPKHRQEASLSGPPTNHQNSRHGLEELLKSCDLAGGHSKVPLVLFGIGIAMAGSTGRPNVGMFIGLVASAKTYESVKRISFAVSIICWAPSLVPFGKSTIRPQLTEP